MTDDARCAAPCWLRLPCQAGCWACRPCSAVTAWSCSSNKPATWRASTSDLSACCAAVMQARSVRWRDSISSICCCRRSASAASSSALAWSSKARRWVLTFSASTLTRWADSFKDSSIRLYSAVPNRACRISSRFCELALRNSKNLPCGSMITWRNCSLLKPSKVSTFSPTFLQPDSTGTSTSRPPSVVRRNNSATCAWVVSRPPRLAGRSCSGTRLTR